MIDWSKNAIFRADEEAAKRSDLEKVKREMENQIEELKEDLEAEKSARGKAERQRREFGEVISSWSIFHPCQYKKLILIKRQSTTVHDVLHVFLSMFYRSRPVPAQVHWDKTRSILGSCTKSLK